MKFNHRLIAISIFALVLFAVGSFYSGSAKERNYRANKRLHSSSAIDGAWKMVWARYNGER